MLLPPCHPSYCRPWPDPAAAAACHCQGYFMDTVVATWRVPVLSAILLAIYGVLVLIVLINLVVAIMNDTCVVGWLVTIMNYTCIVGWLVGLSPSWITRA